MIFSIIGRTILRNLLRVICRVATWIHPMRYKVSHDQEGNMDEQFNARDIAWWMYKYYYKQVELPEPGKGIAEHFEGQDFSFLEPEGFQIRSRVKITAGGDIMPSEYIRMDNIAHVWDDVADFFFDADIVCANLESPLAPSQPFSAIPKNLLIPLKFNNAPDILDACLQEGRGIDLFSLANNHALDRGEEGLLETLDYFDSRGLPHFGTSRSREEQDEVLILQKNNVRIAFLSYTFSLNGKEVPEGKDYLVNRVNLNQKGCDLSLIERHIKIAKEQGADVITACLHWGLEFESYPTQHFIDLGHSLLEKGIDIIIGNHAHGLQPLEKYEYIDQESGNKKQGLIFYALGDLMSWHPAQNTRLGLLVAITLKKGTLNGDEVTLIEDVQYKPTYLYSNMHLEKCSDYRVLDLNALVQRIEQGTEPLPIGKKEVEKIKRLYALQAKLLKAANLSGGTEYLRKMIYGAF